MRPLLKLRVMLAVTLLLYFQGMIASTQESDNPVLIFSHETTLYAMPLFTGNLIEIGTRDAVDLSALPDDTRNRFTIISSPLIATPADGYGYYQGVLSDDLTRFAYSLIAPDSAAYRVMVNDEMVLSGDISAERGYLVPVGWRVTGELILLERYALHSLDDVRIWHLDTTSGRLILYSTFDTRPLSGNHAVLPDGRIFIGFDTTRAQLYLLNPQSNELDSLPTIFTLEDPPRSVFDTYPIDMLAIITQEDFVNWRNSASVQSSADDDTTLEPFLYWMLPDDARNITCYSDTDWTDDNFPVECPGLLQPRSYEGHQGTDVGGLPSGLPLGTSVYAATTGIVLKTFETCPRFDASCGDAYGNHLLMQHVRVHEAEVQVWFTGYAHLQAILADKYDYIENLSVPLALSGDSGLGGAHLHFEVRSLRGWLNPYSDTNSLWIGGNDRPLSVESNFSPPVTLICQSAADNNIRNGPGTSYDITAKTEANRDYPVIQTVSVLDDFAGGDWYQIQVPDTGRTGWLWAELAQNCTSPAP